MNGDRFRFMDLKIWEMAIQVGDRLYDVADQLEQQKKYKFAEQLNSAALSVSNNIAEGAGSNSKKEFKRFLSIARRSVFEDVNMLVVFKKRGLIESSICNELIEKLEHLSRKITTFKRSLE